MAARVVFFAFLAGALATPMSSWARILHVCRDGSGQYAVIQDAVAASSPGDTILIGPGRYPESAPASAPGWTEDACVHLCVDSLWVIGSGAGVTIIGPDAIRHALPARPKGILALPGIGIARIQALSIENLQENVYAASGRLEMTDCEVRGAPLGLAVMCGNGARIRDCRISAIQTGLLTSPPSRGIDLERCRFAAGSSHAAFVGTDEVRVRGCRFQGGEVGVSLQEGSAGTVTECSFDGVASAAMVLSWFSTGTLERNHVIGSTTALRVWVRSSAVGRENVFGPGSGATILVADSSLRLNRSHVLRGSGLAVQTDGFNEPPLQRLDLTENYWGSDDPDSIAAWIHDNLDAPNEYCLVSFEPFASVPLAATSVSLGGLKALYR